jgi:hypothetical protein
MFNVHIVNGRDSIVGKANGSSRYRIPMGARYSARVQTGPGFTQVAVQWVPGLFLRGKTAGALRWPPTTSSAEVKEKMKLHLYFQSGCSWLVLERSMPITFIVFTYY